MGVKIISFPLALTYTSHFIMQWWFISCSYSDGHKYHNSPGYAYLIIHYNYKPFYFSESCYTTFIISLTLYFFQFVVTRYNFPESLRNYLYLGVMDLGTLFFDLDCSKGGEEHLEWSLPLWFQSFFCKRLNIYTIPRLYIMY